MRSEGVEIDFMDSLDELLALLGTAYTVLV